LGIGISRLLRVPAIEAFEGAKFNGHDKGDGELILKHAGKLGFEGVVSKTIDAPYAPGNRGLWRKAKALNRQEFVVVGWYALGDRPNEPAGTPLSFDDRTVATLDTHA
jgi:ATP-dependent DNA ligase